jgi:hypothetical protein
MRDLMVRETALARLPGGKRSLGQFPLSPMFTGPQRITLTLPPLGQDSTARRVVKKG